jgi:hypothetical protein
MGGSGRVEHRSGADRSRSCLHDFLATRLTRRSPDYAFGPARDSRTVAREGAGQGACS